MKIPATLLSFVVSIVITGCGQDATKVPVTEIPVQDSAQMVRQMPHVDSLTTPNNADTITVNYNVLGGDWIRMDGGYIVRIRKIEENGNLVVEYFNPNPIKVSKSYWEKAGSNLFVMVELRDVNYPGSTYMLQYFPEQDKLAGNYFQAVEGNNYNVVFERKK